jgi:hypothetical protein
MRLPFPGQSILFVSFPYKHRGQLSSTGAAHPNPFDVIRKLHNNLSSLNTKADSQLKFVVVVTEQVFNRTRREHFLSGHIALLLQDSKTDVPTSKYLHG